MYAEQQVIAVTTAADGSVVAKSAPVTGRIHSIAYVKDDFVSGVDFAITLERSGESLWTEANVNASKRVYPLAAGNLGASGAASVLTEVPIVAVNDRVVFTISEGGDSKDGSFMLVVT